MSVEAPSAEAMAIFTSSLPEQIELHGDWEVGLSEISIPSLRHNIYSDLHYLDVGNVRLKLRNMLCESIEDVLHDLTRSFNVWRRSRRGGSVKFNVVTTREDAMRLIRQGHAGFYYVKNLQKAGFFFTTNYRFRFSTHLANIMGLEPNVTYYTRHAGFTLGEYKADVRSNRPYRTAYVYTNVIEPVIVGNVKVRLLRTVEMNGNGAEVVHAVFTSPIYVPIQTKNFDVIEINIMNDTGQPLPFLQGNSMVVLHFRKATGRQYLSV